MTGDSANYHQAKSDSEVKLYVWFWPGVAV